EATVPVWDTVVPHAPSSWRMESTGLLLTNLWARGMGTNLRKVLIRNEAALRSFQDHPLGAALPAALALRYPTLSFFDGTFSSRVGGPEPMFPFPDVDTYDWASSHIVLKDVTGGPVDDGGDGCGGHLRWFKAGGGRWVTQPVLEWIRLAAEELVHDFSNQPHFVKDIDGFLRDIGWNGMGVKHMKEDGVVDGHLGIWAWDWDTEDDSVKQ
ncbi:hypothetical protein GGX14DRAFT_479126, partial [Mycena pura]